MVAQLLLRQVLPWGWLLALLLTTVAAYVLRLLSFNVSHYAAFHLEFVLRSGMARLLTSVPLRRVQALGAGALTKVLQDDVRQLHVFVADSPPLYARVYAAPVLTFVVLLWLDWWLALAALAVPALGFVIMGMIMRGNQEMVARYNAAREQISASVVEFLQAMPVVRTFDGGSSSFGRYQQALAAYVQIVKDWYRQIGFRARFSVAVLSPLPTLAVLLWLVAYWFAAGSLSFETWVAVLLLGATMAEAMYPLMMLMHMIERVKISIAQIQALQAELPLPQAAPEAAKLPQDASVCFEQVSFAYDAAREPVLHSVSFTAPSSSVTALVGPSGAGKSTVARLIPRFWEVTGGRVLVGGVDVREMTADTLMQQVAFVFQDTFLFSGSIADNIRWGCPDASMEEVMSAARAFA